MAAISLPKRAVSSYQNRRSVPTARHAAGVLPLAIGIGTLSQRIAIGTLTSPLRTVRAEFPHFAAPAKGFAHSARDLPELALAHSGASVPVPLEKPFGAQHPLQALGAPI